MTAELLVDAHVHVVSRELARYPLQPQGFAGGWYRERPVSAGELRAEMAGAGVARAVLVQAVGAYSFDNAYAVDAAMDDRAHFRAACALDARAADARGELQQLARAPAVTGVRVFALAPPGESWLGDPATFGLWDAARAFGLTAIATAFEHQLSDLARVLAAFPDLPIALDHCGFPDLTRADWEKRSPLWELAGFPKLYLKVSSHLLHAAEQAGTSAVRLVARLAERFGAERLIWGSDYPQTPGPYAELVAQGRAAFVELSPEGRARALGQNALELWFNGGAR
jgi:predicted TIM-barrel fold metal-dependent hydrolase